MATKDTIAEVARRVLSGKDSVVQDLTIKEREYLINTLKEIGVGKTGLIESIWYADYKHIPVDIDTFLDDEKLFGNIGRSMFPAWRSEIKYVTDPKNEINEWIIAGAIGIGKTWVAVICQYYMIYKLICMKNPQEFFGIATGSPIVFGLFNILKFLAQDTAYQYFTSFHSLSPFFHEICYQGNGKSGDDKFIGFPHNIRIAIGANAIHALGQNIFGGLCDEANFGRGSSSTSSDKSQIYDLYSNIRRRIDSRFMNEGGVSPGILCLVSSAKDQSDFLEQHMEDMKGDKRTHVSKFAIWEVKEKLQSEKIFRVIVGDHMTSSKILEDGEQIPENINVINVPELFREKFERDLDSCIRDIAGEPTFGASKLIHRREALFECFNQSTPRQHPFSKEEIFLSIDPEDKVDIEGCVDTPNLLRIVDKINNKFAPLYYKDIPRVIHVDLAKNGDSAGLSMGGIRNIKEVTRYDNDGNPFTVEDFIYFIDLAIKITAVHGSEIDFAKIRSFIFFLRDSGFNIVQVSYDSFQSIGSLQELSKAGFNTKTVSVDRSPAPYYLLKSVIVEHRLDMYNYKPFVREILDLEDLSTIKHKPPIDHPDRGSDGNKGSKDISDAVCGVIYSASTLKGTEIQPSRPDAYSITKAATEKTHKLDELFDD